jgi:transposase-like protein
VTVAEAARRLGVSRVAVFKWIRSGRVRAELRDLANAPKMRGRPRRFLIPEIALERLRPAPGAQDAGRRLREGLPGLQRYNARLSSSSTTRASSSASAAGPLERKISTSAR